ncbi:hypothetical protein CYMTET_16618 [Cymbomonas tetramitiformis]|uniref:Uncharacterized protein n=1 Tax=Cymbomonas tetramitiformis TaxID=36881 RepID=A0AAE0GD17_9CHLO|nr:hypothetical protein CYMTET_16618 [Cymbomonas tetramitiformis]
MGGGAGADSVGIGCMHLQGSKHIWSSLLFGLPPEFRVPSADEDLRLVVFEVARRFPAVTGCAVVAHEPIEVPMQGKVEVFPAGTPIVLNLLLQDWDEDTFDNPFEFNPYRPKLCPFLVAFNSVGDQSPQNRICPGRDLTVDAGVAILRGIHARQTGPLPAIGVVVDAPDTMQLPGMTQSPSHTTVAGGKVRVETGDQLGAGTDGTVRIMLVGSLGKSRSMKLDKKFKDDMEAKSTASYTVPVDSDLGELGAIVVSLDGKDIVEDAILSLTSITKDASTALDLNTSWQVQRIVVSQALRKWIFPCYTWLSEGERRAFFYGASLLPASTPPWLQAIRDEDLTATRKALEWKPIAGLPSAAKSLPLDELWSDGKAYSFLAGLAEMQVNLQFSKFIGNFDKWDSLKDFEDVYSLSLEPPARKEMWRSERCDIAFGSSFLVGSCPNVLQRCSRIPDGMNISRGDQVAGLPAGTSLGEQMSSGKIFIADYRHLERSNPNSEGAVGYTAAGVCLFYSDSLARTLLPIAIQLDFAVADSPVFTTADSEWDWLTAKAHIQCADCINHQVGVHFIHTHAVCEPFAVAARRQLSPLHPILRLLRPHIKCTMGINASARSSLINEGGIVEANFSMGKHCISVFGVDTYRHWGGYMNFPADLEVRSHWNLPKIASQICIVRAASNVSVPAHKSARVIAAPACCAPHPDAITVRQDRGSPGQPVASGELLITRSDVDNEFLCGAPQRCMHDMKYQP